MLNNMFLNKKGNNIYLQNKLNILDTLESKVYLLKYDENIGTYYLYESEQFIIPNKMYGDLSICKKVIHHFNKTKKSSILLKGEKGNGKTLMAKKIAIDSNLPIILINDAFYDNDFISFLVNLNKITNYVLMFDEFEKIYDNYDQKKLLTVLDGVISLNVISIFTINTECNEYLNNRLSRIRYLVNTSNISKELINEIIDDILINNEYKSDLLDIINLYNLNIDTIMEFIKEINEYDENPYTILKYLNIQSVDTRYKIKFYHNNEEINIHNSTKLLKFGSDKLYLDFESDVKDELRKYEYPIKTNNIIIKDNEMYLEFPDDNVIIKFIYLGTVDNDE